MHLHGATISNRIVRRLREHGYDVYDFKNPEPGNTGFHWSEINPKWRTWSSQEFRESLNHPVADAGFNLDMTALVECDVCVLVLPCGRSAHLEAGFAIGAGKPTVILLSGKDEPELMYKMATDVCTDIEEVIQVLPFYEEGTCRVCGCTDSKACEGGCYWVEPDLCSNCVGKEANHENKG